MSEEIPITVVPYADCGTPRDKFYGQTHKHCDMMNVTVMPPFDPGPEFWSDLDGARAEWKRLEEAGTPYWCVHKGREVTHDRAYSKPDQYEEGQGDGIHRKHGVMCADCGGYIQEG